MAQRPASHLQRRLPETGWDPIALHASGCSTIRHVALRRRRAVTATTASVHSDGPAAGMGPILLAAAA